MQVVYFKLFHIIYNIAFEVNGKKDTGREVYCEQKCKIIYEMRLLHIYRLNLLT